MMAAAILRALGWPELPVRRVLWWTIRLAALFAAFPRELAEIAPHWRHPTRRDDSRLVALLGTEPRPPIDIGDRLLKYSREAGAAARGLGAAVRARRGRSSRITGEGGGRSDPPRPQAGTQVPCSPCGTRCGMRIIATGSRSGCAASRRARSLVPAAGSVTKVAR